MGRMELKEIEINKIKVDKNQPRKTFDKESLQFLAESILSNGLLNPIDVDKDYLLIEGERRYRAHKLAGLKTISVRVIKIKNEADRLKRQLIADLLDEKTPTGESYEAIVRLWKMEGSPISKVDGVVEWCQSIGISTASLTRARNWVQDKEEKPELTEGINVGVWREIRTLPKEEIEELKEELKETNEPFHKIVEQKREQIKERKEREKIEQELEEQKKKLGKMQFKIITDRDRLLRTKEEIYQTQRQLNKFKSDVRWMGKTKFYLNTPKQRDNFINFLDGASQGARRWAVELDELKENIAIEIIRE
jgi:ParB/RepB/Spo0J family partition protein